MNTSAAAAPSTSPAALPVPARTLASALAELGHNCGNRCWSAIDDLQATIWFIRLRGRLQTTPTDTLVVVDLTRGGESVLQLRHLIRDVNACTKRDRIQIRERRSNDNGYALAAVAAASDVTHRSWYQFAAAPLVSSELSAAAGNPSQVVPESTGR
jgi:hypothetical protein